MGLKNIDLRGSLGEWRIDLDLRGTTVEAGE